MMSNYSKVMEVMGKTEVVQHHMVPFVDFGVVNFEYFVEFEYSVDVEDEFDAVDGGTFGYSSDPFCFVEIDFDGVEYRYAV